MRLARCRRYHPGEGILECGAVRTSRQANANVVGQQEVSSARAPEACIDKHETIISFARRIH